MNKLLFATLGAVLISGCAVQNQPTIATHFPFSPADVEWATKNGSASIYGNAVMRTMGGDAKTCAGQQVNLIPDSPYARVRLSHMINNWNREGPGFMSARDAPKLDAADPNYVASVKRGVCDAQGNFLFDHLASGKYYVTAEVTWIIPRQYFNQVEGGVLMQPVTIGDGESKRIVLSP